MSDQGFWLKTLMQLNQKQNGKKTMANQMQKKNIVMHVIILPTEKQYKPFTSTQTLLYSLTGLFLVQ